MRLLRFRNKVTLLNKESYDIYTIRLRAIDYFKLHHYETNEIDGIIKFKLVNFIISSGNQGYGWSFNVLREGKIEFVKQPEKFQISWEVKLDTLYFQDICISLFAGIFAVLLLDKGLITSIVVSIAFFFIYLFSGILYIKSKLKGIILKSAFLKFY